MLASCSRPYLRSSSSVPCFDCHLNFDCISHFWLLALLQGRRRGVEGSSLVGRVRQFPELTCLIDSSWKIPSYSQDHWHESSNLQFHRNSTPDCRPFRDISRGSQGRWHSRRRDNCRLTLSAVALCRQKLDCRPSHDNNCCRLSHPIYGPSCRDSSVIRSCGSVEKWGMLRWMMRLKGSMIFTSPRK